MALKGPKMAKKMYVRKVSLLVGRIKNIPKMV